jgi:ABC-type multidrug transport system ATPase subunit
LSDTVAIINKGVIIEKDTPENLKKKIGDEILKVKGYIDIENIRKLKFIESIYTDNEYHIIISKEITKNLNEILKFLKPESIEIKKISLEDVFLKITGKKIEELDE